MKVLMLWHRRVRQSPLGEILAINRPAQYLSSTWHVFSANFTPTQRFELQLSEAAYRARTGRLLLHQPNYIYSILPLGKLHSPVLVEMLMHVERVP